MVVCQLSFKYSWATKSRNIYISTPASIFFEFKYCISLNSPPIESHESIITGSNYRHNFIPILPCPLQKPRSETLKKLPSRSQPTILYQVQSTAILRMNSLSISQLSVYGFLTIPTLYNLFRHGKHGLLGWIYLFIFCILRISGSAMEIKDSISTGAAIVANIGLSPLLLASVGFLHEAFVSFSSSSCNSILYPNGTNDN